MTADVVWPVAVVAVGLLAVAVWYLTVVRRGLVDRDYVSRAASRCDASPPPPAYDVPLSEHEAFDIAELLEACAAALVAYRELTAGNPFVTPVLSRRAGVVDPPALAGRAQAVAAQLRRRVLDARRGDV